MCGWLKMESISQKHKKELLEDYEINQSKVEKVSFERKRLRRIYAVGITFRNVSFSQSEVEYCYFRRCKFDSCTFTGARISNTNFQSSTFNNCRFDYTTFEKTQISLDVLRKNLPAEENLKRLLARSLRVNYQGLGDYEGVNFAIDIEISASIEHYRKAFLSHEPYYRNKYVGLSRLGMGWKYFYERVMYLIWGCGEKPWRLLWLSIFAILMSSNIEAFFLNSYLPLIELTEAALSIFITGKSELQLNTITEFILILLRYVVMGMFIASLVRRQSRR